VIIILSTPGMVDLQRASPYFAIPLYSKEDENLIHMVCEIPKGTVEKMEVNFDDDDHAIMQDITDEGRLRVYKHGAMPYNYGMLPQTYQDPEYECERTGLEGDGDPLDVIEIGSQTLNVGEVVKIKPLGVLALVDEGEIDWKIIGINAKDDMAAHLEGKLLSDCSGTL
jgi:inorganic pyrophosphatase